MLLARFLLAGSVALMVAWALLVGALFRDPSLLRDGSIESYDVSLELAVAIEQIELLRGEVAALRDAQASAPAQAASEAVAAAPSIPVAAGAPPDEAVGDEAVADEAAEPLAGGGAPPLDGDADYEPPQLHRIVQGESLTSIAQLYGTTVEELSAANGLRDPGAIRVGGVLTIP